MSERWLPSARDRSNIDATLGFDLFSFMDTFSSYNQIWTVLEDEGKTSLLLIGVYFVT